MQPRPESRISTLEKRTSALEASVEELSSDTAENFRSLKQDISQLSDKVDLGFRQAHAYIDEHLDKLKATQDKRFNKLEQKLDLILQLLQKKGE